MVSLLGTGKAKLAVFTHRCPPFVRRRGQGAGRSAARAHAPTRAGASCRKRGTAEPVDEGFGRKARGVKVREKEDLSSRRSSRQQRRSARAEARADAAPVKEEIFEVGEAGMAVGDLAARLAVTPGEVVKTLFRKGLMVAVNQVPAPRRAAARRAARAALQASLRGSWLQVVAAVCLHRAAGEQRTGRGAGLCCVGA